MEKTTEAEDKEYKKEEEKKKIMVKREEEEKDEEEEEEKEEKEEEEEEEKIPHMYESIGHRPLRGRCPASPSTSSTSYLCQVDTVQFYWLLNSNMSYHRIRRKMIVHSEDNWRSLFHFCI